MAFRREPFELLPAHRPVPVRPRVDPAEGSLDLCHEISAAFGRELLGALDELWNVRGEERSRFARIAAKKDGGGVPQAVVPQRLTGIDRIDRHKKARLEPELVEH